MVHRYKVHEASPEERKYRKKGFRGVVLTLSYLWTVPPTVREERDSPDFTFTITRTATEYHINTVIVLPYTGNHRPGNPMVYNFIVQCEVDMDARPGFETANVNQDIRAAENQEHINRRVLSEYIRVISMPNPDHVPLKELMKMFLDNVVKYSNSKDPTPLMWPTTAGRTNDLYCFRAKMSYLFWEYFTNEGRKRLVEYNKAHHCQIRVLRDQTLSLSDVENLSLYLRSKIRLYCTENKLPVPDIAVKNGYITVGDLLANGKRFRSTELAVLLGWNYADWNGTAISKLMSNTEKKNLAERRLSWGSLHIEKLLPRRSLIPANETNEENADGDADEQNTANAQSVGTRKRAGTEEGCKEAKKTKK